MRNDTIIEAAGLTITLTGETNTFASVTIDGREYTGEVGNPVGKFHPRTWISRDLYKGLCHLDEADFCKVVRALSDAMQ
jgi:hypothetical protein